MNSSSRRLCLATAVALSLPLGGCMMAMMPAMHAAVAGSAAAATYAVDRPPQTVYDDAVAVLAAGGRVELADPLRRGAVGYDADGRYRIAFSVRSGARLDRSEIALKVEPVSGPSFSSYGEPSERLQAFVAQLGLRVGEPLVAMASP